MDFGDSPSCYPVHAFRDGARHLQTSTEGTTGDGITLPPAFQAGAGAPVSIHASADGKVEAWIDGNADGLGCDANTEVLKWSISSTTP